MQEVIPNVYTFTGLLVGRVYLLRDPEGLTIVDAGLSSASGKILAQLAKAGHQPSDVKRILITHAHPDHAGGLSALQQATGAQVLCHALEKPVIQGEIPIPRRESGLRPPKVILKPAPVGQTLDDGAVLPILGGLQAVFTPGHAPGHLAFWLTEHRLLMTGDVIFYMLNRMTLPIPMATVDMAENKRSVRKLVDLQPDTVMFGHGQPIVGQAAARLNAFAAKIGV